MSLNFNHSGHKKGFKGLELHLLKPENYLFDILYLFTGTRPPNAENVTTVYQGLTMHGGESNANGNDFNVMNALTFCFHLFVACIAFDMLY